MISGNPPITRAISAFMAGVALFLLACQARTVVEEAVVIEPAQALFAAAEQAFQAGEYDKALETYERYLEEYPGGEASGTALYRMARIHDEKARYPQALTLLRRILAEYPRLPRLPEVRYDLAKTLYRLGDYRQSEAAALGWLAEHPGHPLQGDLFMLLGNLSVALRDRPKAFFWWLRAEGAFYDSPPRRAEIAGRLEGLIEDSSPDDLKKIADYASGSRYAPPAYHRLATIYLEGNDLEQAKAMAIALVRSTPEQNWVSAGRRILARIEAEQSVKPGAIGCLLPLSGPFAIYGQEVLNGIQLGMGLFDESGAEQSLELIIRDTGGKLERAVSGVQELGREGKVMAIIGPLTSKPALAAARKAQEVGIPIITMTQVDGITAEGDMVFRNFLTPTKEIKGLLNKAIKDMTLRRFGIFYPENFYGRFFMNLFWDRVEEMGGVIQAVESYSPNETDFAVQIKKMVGLHYPRPESVVRMLNEIKALEAEETIELRTDSEDEPDPIVDFEAVFIPDTYQQVALIAPQFPFHNVFNVRLLGTSLWQSPQLIEHAGDYIQGAVFPSGFFSQTDSDGTRRFVDTYKDNFDSEPGVLAATGYDTIRFMKNIMTKGEIKTRKELQTRLLGSDSFHGLTGNIAFDRQGEVVKEPLLLSVSGRRLVILP